MMQQMISHHQSPRDDWEFHQLETPENVDLEFFLVVQLQLRMISYLLLTTFFSLPLKLLCEFVDDEMSGVTWPDFLL